MDEKKARRQLQDVKVALNKLDEEREFLVSLIHGYEGWLRLHGSSNGAATLTVRPRAARQSGAARTAPKGSVSLRQAVLQIVREAQGSPVHIREILARALAMGAATNAQHPERIVDLVAYNLKSRSNQPLERVSPRSWRWTGK